MTDLVDFIYRDGAVAKNMPRWWAEDTKNTPEGRGGRIREIAAADCIHVTIIAAAYRAQEPEGDRR